MTVRYRLVRAEKTLGGPLVLTDERLDTWKDVLKAFLLHKVELNVTETKALEHRTEEATSWTQEEFVYEGATAHLARVVYELQRIRN